MSFDLFEREEKVIKRGRALCEATEFDAEAARVALAELLKEYEKLFKSSRRLVRISDRNEAELNAMAEKQRLAAEEIARKNKELEVLSSKLAKYLSPQVYNSIFTGAQEVKLASQRKKLTVFFSDVAGFAETTDKMESEDLTTVLNHYLTEMSKVALEHGATLDKYIGDAMMLFFGDPETRGSQGRCACLRKNGARHAKADARAGRVLARLRYRGAASLPHRDSYRLLHGRQFRKRGPHGLHHHRGSGEHRLASRARGAGRKHPHQL